MELRLHIVLKKKIICIQRFVRGYLARKKYLKQKNAAIMIQKC